MPLTCGLLGKQLGHSGFKRIHTQISHFVWFSPTKPWGVRAGLEVGGGLHCGGMGQLHTVVFALGSIAGALVAETEMEAG